MKNCEALGNNVYLCEAIPDKPVIDHGSRH